MAEKIVNKTGPLTMPLSPGFAGVRHDRARDHYNLQAAFEISSATRQYARLRQGAHARS